mgnify:CR=1 FL=1
MLQRGDVRLGEVPDVDEVADTGAVAGVYTVSTKAKDVLGWEAELTETDAVRDAIAWLPVRKERLGY